MKDHDLGLRHKSGMTANEFIRRYCEVFRPYAVATRDDSLNEFEKLITHVLHMLDCHKRRAELLGLPRDPRDSISKIEQAVSDLESARMRLTDELYKARSDGMTIQEIIEVLQEFDPSLPLIVTWEGQGIEIRPTDFYMNKDCDKVILDANGY